MQYIRRFARAVDVVDAGVVGGWLCRILIASGLGFFAIVGLGLLWRWLHPKPVREIILYDWHDAR